MHTFDLSDEDVVWQWLENPYWQVFTDETYLQTKPPIDPSSLTRWCQRLSEASVDELLTGTIEAAKRVNVVKSAGLKRAIVDTTVMEISAATRVSPSTGVKVYHPGLRRGTSRGPCAMIRRCSAIEPAIGNMKADGKLDRNWLKGALGDAIHAVRRRSQRADDPA